MAINASESSETGNETVSDQHFDLSQANLGVRTILWNWFEEVLNNLPHMNIEAAAASTNKKCL